MIFEEQFRPPQPLPTEKENQAAILMVRFTLVSIVFGIGYWLFSFITGFLFVRYQMVVVCTLFMVQLIAFKKSWLTTRQASHWFVLICWLIVASLTMASGGTMSYVLPWISLIPIIALVLLSKRAAIRWCIAGVLTVLIFFVGKPNVWIPPSWVLPSIESWVASLNLGLLFIMLTLVYIFYEQQAVLISTIENRNVELRESKYELERVQKIIEEQHRLLQVKNEGLEVEIEKRTHELVRYNQQLEQFTFIASHNLRSPIARILGLASLLDIPGEDHKEIRERLVHATRDLDQVVKDLNVILNIRKNSDLIYTQLNWANELATILSALEKDIQEAGAIIKQTAYTVETIRSVRPYFHSILMNLISNGIKYKKPEQPPVITIQVSMNENNVLISVSDTGIGMDMNAIGSKIFTLYSRFHTHVHGRGLGLYLVKSQVEALGGKVHVESKPNQGSTFHVYLPQ